MTTLTNLASNWVKKPVTKQEVEALCSEYNLKNKISENAEKILASILVRRGITSGKELLYYLEEDLRFQHTPFSFTGMEDAVDRIMQANEEGEKIKVRGREELAIAFQHEIDHLNGILFVDRIDKKNPFKNKDLYREI